MTLRRFSLAVGLACLLLSGCSGRYAATYRILGDPRAPVLVPPGVEELQGNRTTVAVRPATRDPDCQSPGPGIDVRVRRRSVNVSIRQEAVEQASPGQLSLWADTLSDGGCLPHDRRSAFVRSLLEAFPLGVTSAYRIAYGQPPSADSIDIVPGQTLKVVGPVLRDDSAPLELTVERASPDETGGLSLQVRSSANLAGYEESWYSVAVAANGDLRLEHERTNFMHDGETTALDQPAVTSASFIPSGRFSRMVYLTRVAETADHDKLFVSAATRDELETRSAAVLMDPGQCREEHPEAWCRGAPKSLAINLYVEVVLNGETVEVAPGLPLGQLVRGGFSPRAMVAPVGLEVYRPHGGRLAKVDFEPSSGSIMALPLLGGERIVLPRQSSEP